MKPSNDSNLCICHGCVYKGNCSTRSHHYCDVCKSVMKREGVYQIVRECYKRTVRVNCSME